MSHVYAGLLKQLLVKLTYQEKRKPFLGAKIAGWTKPPNDVFNSVRAYHERIETLHSKERKVFFSAHFESSGFE